MKRAGKAQDERKERSSCSSGANPFISQERRSIWLKAATPGSSSICKDEPSGWMKAEAFHRGMLLPTLYSTREREMCVHQLRGQNHRWSEKTQDPAVLSDYSYNPLSWQNWKAIRKLADGFPPKKIELFPPPHPRTELPSGQCLQRLENSCPNCSRDICKETVYLITHFYSLDSNRSHKQTASTSTFQLRPMMLHQLLSFSVPLRMSNRQHQFAWLPTI